LGINLPAACQPSASCAKTDEATSTQISTEHLGVVLSDSRRSGK
jgi:hypothetical protein